MTKKELFAICEANGIQPLIYDWKFSSVDNKPLVKRLEPIYSDIESFLMRRETWYIHLSDTVLSSRLAVLFFKVAQISNFVRSYYTNPIRLAEYRREDWYDNADFYSVLVNADLLIVDEVTNRLEQFQKKIWDSFVEERLSKRKTTIFSGNVGYKKDVFSDRAIDLMLSVDAKVLTDTGLSLC